MQIYWLTKDETAVESGPHPLPATINRYGVVASLSYTSLVHAEECVRLAHGRFAPKKPSYNAATQKLGSVDLDAPGGELFYPVIDLTAEEVAAIEQQRVIAAVERVWQVATDHEQRYIANSAIGMLTAGVLSNAPKCVAVKFWIASIWNKYYTHKDEIVAGAVFDEATMCNFEEAVGPIPHTVPELRQETGF